MLSRVLYAVGRGIRETGQSLEKTGLLLQGNHAYKEPLNRHRKVMGVNGEQPKISENTNIAHDATIVGNTEIGENTTVGYGTVIRGDVNRIRIGKNASIGDRSIIHCTQQTLKNTGYETNIGDNTYVGTGVTIHGATLEDNSVVETGAIVMDGSVVGSESIVSAGSLLLEGTLVPSGELWQGAPAKYVRKLNDTEIENMKQKTADSIKQSLFLK
eukprot:TRINITY_DN675_c0_g1_i1.p1 TRINITY_DN675_c0_g1~~TRINITY_DN675_c0_g1_i1.p1  ORF type:complete len:214 (-),score=49.07 TRINITY_DN675_c0_g1_i1:82-723(-)